MAEVKVCLITSIECSVLVVVLGVLGAETSNIPTEVEVGDDQGEGAACYHERGQVVGGGVDRHQSQEP